MSTLYLGVDAGGSHSTAIVGDETGAVLGKAHGEPAAVRPTRELESARAIVETCLRARREKGVKGRPAVLVVGAAGAGSATAATSLRAALRDADIADKVHVTTDAEIALIAAFGDAPGIVALAGTGSVGWARLPDGTMSRVGGLGPALGDPGSGYDLGRGGLRAAALAFEGLGPATKLREMMLPERATLDAAVAAQHATEVRLVAVLARVVIEAADAGDAVAQDIVEKGAADLARHVAVLVSRFPEGPVRVALGGGLLSAVPSYRERVINLIRNTAPSADVTSEPLEPAMGALRLSLSLGHKA